MGGLTTIWLDSLVQQSVQRRLLKISWMYISCVVVEGRVVDSDMNSFSTLSSFSGNLFAILVYYLQVRDVSCGMVVGNTVLVNCTVDMTVVFFYSIFQTSAGLSYVGKFAIFSGLDNL